MINNRAVRLLVFISIIFTSFLVASNDGVKIKARQVGDNVVVDGVNNNPFSITVTYNATFTNLKSEKKLPLLFVLQGKSKEEV